MLAGCGVQSQMGKPQAVERTGCFDLLAAAGLQQFPSLGPTWGRLW